MLNSLFSNKTISYGPFHLCKIFHNMSFNIRVLVSKIPFIILDKLELNVITYIRMYSYNRHQTSSSIFLSFFSEFTQKYILLGSILCLNYSLEPFKILTQTSRSSFRRFVSFMLILNMYFYRRANISFRKIFRDWRR